MASNRDKLILKFKIFWRLVLAHWKKNGLFWLIRRIFFKMFTLILGLLLQPLALIAHLLGFRRINVSIPIGHLASEPDCFLKLMQLNLLQKKRYFVAVSSNRIANRCLLDYWNKHIEIITNPFLSYILSAASSYGLMKFDVTEFVNKTTAVRYYDVISQWGRRQPILTLSHSHRQKGLEGLRRLGMPEDAWYVCLHVREGGFGPLFESVHSYRNADINNHRKAIKTIASQGGWVVRMGDPTMKKLEGVPNCIDYAHSAEKSDWMDVFLCGNCRLFIGDTSGLFLVSTAFGVPVANVNMIPLSVRAFSPNDIFIPKLLREKKSGRYLSFSEIFQSPIANFWNSIHYLDSGIEIEENSPEDINQVVEEALLRIQNKWKSSPEDEKRQAKFSQLLRTEHYGYKSQSKVGSAFLVTYEHLI